MNDRKNRPISDAEWYFRKEPETERFYEIFFQLCRKYNVHWASATLKENTLSWSTMHSAWNCRLQTSWLTPNCDVEGKGIY